MSMPQLHVVGAGLAGLSTALYSSLGGAAVTLYEGTLHAGGRCRSYHDRELDCRIDNGNHLMLSGNLATMDYIGQIGATDTLDGPDAALYPFFDVRSGQHWRVNINKGYIPWWMLCPGRRAPGTSAFDYFSVFKLLFASDQHTMQDLYPPHHPLYESLYEPLTVAIHNTHPSEASARLMRTVFMQSFGNGAGACMPRVPKVGLSETLVDPCLARLGELGTTVKFGRRLRGIIMDETRIIGLDFTDGIVQLAEDDWVVLALPGWVMTEVIPTLPTPNSWRSIVNAHYRLDVPKNEAGMTGMIGGLAQWVFVKPGIVSVTVSAADHLQNTPTPEIAARVWHDIAMLYQLDPASIPPHRVVKEKRATFAATPAIASNRPTAATPWQNLLLAGDYTDTSLPATIEGSIRSGLKAAQIYLRWMH